MNHNLLTKHVVAVLKYQKDPIRALEIFNSVKNKDGFNHNLTTYKCMIENLANHGQFEAMEAVFTQMRSDVDNSLLEGAYLSAMKSYGRSGKIQEAINVFERMDFYSCEPGVHSYNSIMNILVEYGYFDQAHKVYMRMKDKGIVPDVCTFTIRIKSFCRRKRSFAALRLLKNMFCELNSIAYCTVIGGFYEEGNQNDAYKLFDEMLERSIFPNVVTFNKLIHTLCKKGDVQESERLFGKVLKRGISPNVFTFNIFIKGLCKTKRITEAARMLDCADRDSLTPDVVTFNTLIYGLCKNSKVVEAERCRPDIWTYNLLIDGLCKMGCMSDAYSLLNDALAKGFVPDVYTFNTMIDGYCKQLKMNPAIEIMINMEMEKVGVTPDEVIYGTLLNGFCENGDLVGAYDLFQEKNKNNISHTTPAFNIMIKAFSEKLKMDLAQKLFDEMPGHGCPPDDFTFRCMINGFCKMGDVDAGHKFLLEKIKHGFIPTLATFGQVLNCLCVKHRVKEAVDIIHIMVQKEIVPDSVSTIFEADKRVVAAPKIVVEDLLRKSHITYYAYELLYDGVRNKKLVKKKVPTKIT
ncbi:hypothetical protein E3N88_39455 [Mikania micrantha]|uniref:Pentacotripeptide-repeat region of PRORP domain-containing protein n=1 Tax=Mikania micrantha TaxID=192012 RepID=A0A5N6LWU7_9ASTR|nr:hypothetical protein E3N88_39455 [Mikania micrantha]